MDKRTLRASAFWLRGSWSLFAVTLTVVFATSLADTAGAVPAGWSAARPLKAVHGAGGTPTLTLLQDGRVLLVGGNSAEIYDPATNEWRLTGPLMAPRFKHTATLLTNGQVLIAGGVPGTYQGLATAELFDPVRGTWSATGNMSAARVLHSATLLPNGLVLVAGGCANWEWACTPSVTAELYDPQTKKWMPAASMATPRNAHSATLLRDGTVLVAGGFFYRTGGTASAEIFSPPNSTAKFGAWKPTGAMPDSRGAHGVARLPDGTVLVAGGKFSGCCAGLATADVYKPDTKTWTRVGAMSTGRDFYEALTLPVLPNGAVLAAGGYSCCLAPETIRSSVDSYNPQTKSWGPAKPMNAPHLVYVGVVLKNGVALYTDGYSAEFFQQ